MSTKISSTPTKQQLSQQPVINEKMTSSKFNVTKLVEKEEVIELSDIVEVPNQNEKQLPVIEAINDGDKKQFEDKATQMSPKNSQFCS